LKNTNKKILIIIQRSNGDVFLSSPLISTLFAHYKSPEIDLLINEDTSSIAELLPYVNDIHLFSYKEKKENRWKQEKNLILKIYKKYDLSINLTSSDRSVFYALLAGKLTISAIEKNILKSFWKKFALTKCYYFDSSKHILENNLQALNLLEIEYKQKQYDININAQVLESMKQKLKLSKVDEFFVFHASTQYQYKIYPKHLRNILLSDLSNLGISIIVTGGRSSIDLKIKKELPLLPNVFDFIGETSIEEFFALSKLSLGYIGMDTINMHIAASQNKRIFAIFGPTNLKMWSPWSNHLGCSAVQDRPKQRYGEISIFQADMACVACGKAGCDDSHGKSECLDNIDPKIISNEIKNWYLESNYKAEIPVITESESTPRQILLYIVYGDNQTYYDGAIFSFLTFSHWIKNSRNPIEIVVLTEKPELFNEYPVRTLLMTQEQKVDWSLDGLYHFRIKNRGLAYVIDELSLKEYDKVLFLDTDTYFHKSPITLFDLIKSNQALFYLNEGLIFERKRFHIYVERLKGKKIQIDGKFYELSKQSALWGSLMVGITCSMRPSLDWADKLMLEFFKLVPAHTIEPFALSESLLRKYSIVEGKNYVSLYSTSRKKEYCSMVMADFFNKYKTFSIKDQTLLAQKVNMKRPLFKIIMQRMKKVFS
jgi:heptosyltransferase III